MDVPSPAKEDIQSYGGGSRGPIGVEMRDDPDEQEQIRRLRERGSHQSAPVTPPKSAPPRKAGRNKVSGTVVLEPENTPPARAAGSRAAGSWCADDNIIPWSAPEEWRNSWDADRL